MTTHGFKVIGSWLIFYSIVGLLGAELPRWKMILISASATPLLWLAWEDRSK